MAGAAGAAAAMQFAQQNPEVTARIVDSGSGVVKSGISGVTIIFVVLLIGLVLLFAIMSSAFVYSSQEDTEMSQTSGS